MLTPEQIEEYGDPYADDSLTLAEVAFAWCCGGIAAVFAFILIQAIAEALT